MQSYAWKVPQHINILEFIAFLNYLRMVTRSSRFFGLRFFHMFGSQVVTAVVAKGRSSSRLLNRLCRRTAAYTLSVNAYALSLWTISSWNHSDAASRRWEADHG